MRALIILILSFVLPCSVLSSSVTYMAFVSNEPDELPRRSIQDRIMTAFTNSFVAQNNSELVALLDEMSISYGNSKNSMFLYWKGYAYYYNSIIQLKSSDRKSAYEELNKGIKTLESIETKNSEDYALLSMLYSFSCQFLSFPEIIHALEHAVKYIDKALKLDENNLRAYYVLANNDYYTPEVYGGGVKVEQSLLKALSLPIQSVNNSCSPSWGRQECFELITNFYLRKGIKEKARKYIEQGLAEYPDSYTLQYNKTKL